MKEDNEPSSIKGRFEYKWILKEKKDDTSLWISLSNGGDDTPYFGRDDEPEKAAGWKTWFESDNDCDLGKKKRKLYKDDDGKGEGRSIDDMCDAESNELPDLP